MTADPRTISLLAEDLARFQYDPLGYVLWAFPWGQAGTPLEGETGPRPWQRNLLVRWGTELKRRGFNGSMPVEPLQVAIASGHGIGKSAFTAMAIKFIMDTRPNAKGVVTANTGDQLRTKTWAELAKWHNISLTRELFEYANSRGNMSLVSVQHPQTWRCDAMTCREENSEAFAGLHAKNSTPFYIFDEASAVPAAIWEVAHGGLTDGEPHWFVFGNPTQASGNFRDCFGSNAHRWITEQIDSRTVPGTNKELMEQWVQDYGEDSDFVRVRVRGQFPRSAACQLISEAAIELAFGKHLRRDDYSNAARVLGVDVARFGDDKSVIFLRQGLASWKLGEWRGITPKQLAVHVAYNEDKYVTDATFIDSGMGFATVDELVSMGRAPIEVIFGASSPSVKCANMRAFIWWGMKEWLERGGAIPSDQDLRKQLVAQEYFYNAKDQVQLVKKEDMKKLGLESPDDADALALTFSAPVRPKSALRSAQERMGGKGNTVKHVYDVLEM